MKKRDIIKLVKETITERRGRYGQHDYYGNNVGGRSSISGMPGVWEEKNEPQGPWSAGLEAREIADSFDFEEIEQLYKDGLIDSSNYNGAKWILQGWIDQHPTYLPQRDLSEPKRQRIRARYDTSAAGLIPGDPDWPGEDDRDNFPDPKDLKENKDKYLNENKMKKIKVQEDIAEKGALEEGSGDLEHIQKGKMVHLNEYFEDIGKMKLGNTTIDVGYAKMDLVPGTGEEPASSKFSEPLAEYIKERGDSNLMEHMDRHRKRPMLMESAMKRLFSMFDNGMTDEEVVQDHAQKGVEVPEAFISKIRKQWEGLKKAELELDMGEKEYKNSARDIVNNPVGSETGMEPSMEAKQLATGLTS